MGNCETGDSISSGCVYMSSAVVLAAGAVVEGYAGPVHQVAGCGYADSLLGVRCASSRSRVEHEVGPVLLVDVRGPQPAIPRPGPEDGILHFPVDEIRRRRVPLVSSGIYDDP